MARERQITSTWVLKNFGKISQTWTKKVSPNRWTYHESDGSLNTTKHTKDKSTHEYRFLLLCFFGVNSSKKIITWSTSEFNPNKCSKMQKMLKTCANLKRLFVDRLCVRFLCTRYWGDIVVSISWRSAWPRAMVTNTQNTYVLFFWL